MLEYFVEHCLSRPYVINDGDAIGVYIGYIYKNRVVANKVTVTIIRNMNNA